MTDKICYWDDAAGMQLERDMTVDEQAELDALRAAAASTHLPKLISTLLKKIDADVDAIYAETIGHRATEYTLAEEDAKLYKEAGYTGVVPVSVQSWATAKSQTATWAADDILATATNWRTAQAAIRGTRLLRKEQARVAADATALTSVEVQWVGFVTAIRASLGLA